MRLEGSRLRDLAGRYVEVLRQSWRIRHELEAPKRAPYETQFLAAHLEIIDTPVHPAPQWTARVIAALALAAALVLALGHLDIVAVAHGKLVPGARVKIIQPAVTGVVRNIMVQNGAHVVAGQLLLELDPSQAVADTDKATATKLDAQQAAARARALLRAQAEERPPSVDVVPGSSGERQLQVQNYAVGIYTEYRNRLASLQAQLAQRQAELGSVRDEIDRLNVTAPLARQQAKDYQALSANNYVARDDYLAKEQAALKEEGDLRGATDRKVQLAAAVEEQKQQIATTVAAFKKEQLEELEKAEEALAQSTQDQTKAEVRQKLMQLVAPVAGTVQNLSVHTVGGVVTTAQALMEIVPEDTLEVEASLENKDIGFVEVGQEAIVKIDAFPYTRFGYLRGQVASVSNDAVEDKKNGLLYVVHVKLPTNQIRVGARDIDLTPGMQVVAEIRTGRRTVAEYLFSPFIKTVDQSLRER